MEKQNHIEMISVIPKVSVWVITYNHAGYIGQCLESILSQVTNHSFEICIGEDDSSDGTREICLEYARKYPHIISLFLRDRNDPARAGCAGPWQFNFIETFKACRGEYVAACDGDDFWTDPYKLQKQVDFLDRHHEYSGCFHKIAKVDEVGRIICADTGYPPKRQESYSLDFLLRHSNFSPMFSVVFRNHEDVAPDWIKLAPFGDMIIHAGNLLRGEYGFIDEIMGCYRIHSGGLASGTTRMNNVKATLMVYRLIGEHFGLFDRPAYRQGVRALRVSLAIEWLMELMLPKSVKLKFDTSISPQLRSMVRRVLTLGR